MTICTNCGLPKSSHGLMENCVVRGVLYDEKFKPLTATKHYEVWASIDGSCAAWRRLPGGTFHGDAGKQIALERAEQEATAYAQVCVEEWDSGRSVYLSTIRSYPK